MKKIRKFTAPLTVVNQFKSFDTSNTTKKTYLFEGKEFCILNSKYTPKELLEKLIFENGGRCVQTPTNDTYCLVASTQTLKVKNKIEKGEFDIVDPIYIKSCIESNKFLLFEPKYLLFAREETKQKLLEEIDIFGDSYTEDINSQQIKSIFDEIVLNDNKNFNHFNNNLNNNLINLNNTENSEKLLPKTLKNSKSSVTSLLSSNKSNFTRQLSLCSNNKNHPGQDHHHDSPPFLTDLQILQLEKKYFVDPPCLSIFRGFSFFFDLPLYKFLFLFLFIFIYFYLFLFIFIYFYLFLFIFIYLFIFIIYFLFIFIYFYYLFLLFILI